MSDGAQKNQNVFGKWSSAVDGFFAKRFYNIGLFVGTRPCTSLGLTLVFVLVCCGGFSQMHAESRGDKLWIPQGTQAQEDQKAFDSVFPALNRMEMVLLESKGSNILNKKSLTASMKLFNELASTTAGNDTMLSLCVPQPGRGHPCFINSVLEMWSYNEATLAADANPLATINAAGKSKEDLQRMLGDATFSAGGQLTGAKSLTLMMAMQSNRVMTGGGYEDKRGRDWEEKFLEKIVCDKPNCDTEGDLCACGYDSPEFMVYANAQRSRRDVFGTTIRGDVGLINAAFAIMIVYVTLNLGGLCHKIKMRSLLALGCILSIVLAGAAGYGVAMYLQFDYTPVMSVLPFVLLGIGVDDSFVIMNSLDHVGSGLELPQRIATAMSHAGVSIMITSITDFVAFAISATSALPALAAFCAYAAFAILFLFLFQITFFMGLAALNARREDAGKIDCCPCLCAKGCPCCPTVPLHEVKDDGSKDPNQLCCAQSRHKGGKMGTLLENYLGPLIVKTPVAVSIIIVAIGFCGLNVWQASELSVEDATIKFIPDDSYVMGYTKKTDRYFGTLGQGISMVTRDGDYFGSQAALNDIGNRVDKLDFMQSSNGDSFVNWAASYKSAIMAGSVGTTVAHNSGVATVKSQYYAGLKTWLAGAGKRYAKDVKWVSNADAQQGIKATRIAAEVKPFNRVEDGKLIINSGKAVEVMDKLRDAVTSWTDLPKPFAYSYIFLSWEVFRIIKKEMFLNVSLCMVAVLVIMLIFLAHPGIACLVLLVVLMTIIEVLGCMNMWGLAIDNVSVIQLVIAVGLAVDYSAHVGHAFMTKSGTRAERVVATLGDVGAAVLNGGISTFLAVMLLALSKSYVFRVLFQTFFLTVVLGLTHGMIVLPAFLALMGPEGYSGRAVEISDASPEKLGKEIEA